MIKHLLILLIFFNITAPSIAATYYVSSSNGDDDDPGTKNSPWAHCPGMAGWSGSTQLKAGDTVYFKNTDTWTASSGTSVLDVKGGLTYDGSSWGEGTRATLRPINTFRYNVIRIADDHPTVETVARGFYVDQNGYDVTGVGVNFPSSRKDLTGAIKRVEDCVITATYAPRKISSRKNIKVGATNNHKTHNVEILNNVCLESASESIAIYSAIKSDDSIIRNVLVRGNDVSNSGLWGNNSIGIKLKNNIYDCIVEYNHCHNNDKSGINVENTFGDQQGPSDLVIRYNICRNNGSHGIGLAQDGNKENIEIYGNLVFDNGNEGIKFSATLSEATVTAKVYSNTVYNNAGVGINVQSSSASFPNLEVKNNIVYRNHSAIANPGNKITSQSNNLTTNPNFKNTSNLPTGFIGTPGVDIRPNKDGLSVESGPAVDGGVKLDSRYDIAINSVLRTGAWDIGAYEHGGIDTTPIAKPQRLRVIEQ